MAFILTENRLTREQTQKSFERYRAYLNSLCGKFPASAYRLAIADWYFGGGSRSPHDAWLESISIRELSSGERKQIRCSQIQITLLGAYHDGFIDLRYDGVLSYDLTMTPPSRNAEFSHGDWLYDEFTLTERGNVLHEIEWQAARWRIEAADIHYQWRDR